MNTSLISWNKQTPVNLNRITFITTETLTNMEGVSFHEIHFIEHAPIFEQRYFNENELDKIREQAEFPYKIIEQKPISWVFDTEKERDDCYEWILKHHTVNDQSHHPMSNYWEAKSLPNTRDDKQKTS